MAYAPAGHNTTLTCAVSGITLLWEVNGFRFGDSTSQLHKLGIFQSQVMSDSSLSTLNSTLLVLGVDSSSTSEFSICCLSRMTEAKASLEMCCTTLFVYSEFHVLIIIITN